MNRLLLICSILFCCPLLFGQGDKNLGDQEPQPSIGVGFNVGLIPTKVEKFSADLYVELHVKGKWVLGGQAWVGFEFPVNIGVSKAPIPIPRPPGCLSCPPSPVIQELAESILTDRSIVVTPSFIFGWNNQRTSIGGFFGTGFQYYSSSALEVGKKEFYKVGDKANAIISYGILIEKGITDRVFLNLKLQGFTTFLNAIDILKSGRFQLINVSFKV